jgi:hypothetical protein
MLPTPPHPPPILHEPHLGLHRFNLVVLGIGGGIAAAGLAYVVFHSLLVAALVAVPAGFGVSRLPDVIGRTVAAFFFPSGRTTPPPAGHSQARALAVQGHLDAALAVYETTIAEDPGDPQPYIDVARLYRDRLERPADALAWFRRAAAAARLTPAHDALIVRELTELCVDRLKQPLRAAPELARLARSRPDALEGQWACRELDRIRAEALAAERPDAPPGPELP